MYLLLLTHLDILSSRKLPLFQYSLLVDKCTHFMRVDKRVIFTNFPYKSLCTLSRCQENLRNVENFLLNFTWGVDVECTRLHYKQEFLVVRLGCWKTDDFEHCV